MWKIKLLMIHCFKIFVCALPDLSPGSFRIIFSLLLRALAAWYDTLIPKYIVDKLKFCIGYYLNFTIIAEVN